MHYVLGRVGRIARQLPLRCRSYGTVKYIRRNCHNYGRKAPDPVVIHRQGTSVVLLHMHIGEYRLDLTFVVRCGALRRRTAPCGTKRHRSVLCL